MVTDTPHGLTNYDVQTAGNKHAQRVAQRLRSGMVEMNSKFGGAGSPFGGMEHSDNGREGGHCGLEESLEVETVSDRG